MLTVIFIVAALVVLLLVGFVELQRQVFGNTLSSILSPFNEQDRLDSEFVVQNLTETKTVLPFHPIQEVFSNAHAITSAEINQDGRLFVADQIGLLYRDNMQLYDFRSRLNRFGNLGERGLLGLAISPFNQNHLFISITISPKDPSEYDHDLVVERYNISNESLTQPLEILRIPQKNSIHNGGCIRFGPIDQLLYIAVGDGGPQGDPDGNAQNTQLLQGKLLRIDVSNANESKPYEIPTKNPKTVARREILALGLRNPWQFQFSPDGSVFVGDVGWSAREAIHLYSRETLESVAETGNPINSRWPYFEGNKQRQPDLSGLEETHHIKQGPIYQYKTGGLGGGRSVIGGIPFENKYLFSDYLTASLYVIEEQTDFGWKLSEIFTPQEWLGKVNVEQRKYLTSISFDAKRNIVMFAVNENGSATADKKTGKLFAATMK